MDTVCLVCQVTVNCSFPGDLEVILKTNRVTRASFKDSTQGIDSRSTGLAQNVSRLLAAVGFDYFYVAIFVNDEITYNNNVPMPVTTFSFPFRLGQNSTIELLSEPMIMTRAAILMHASQRNLENIIS